MSANAPHVVRPLSLRHLMRLRQGRSSSAVSADDDALLKSLRGGAVAIGNFDGVHCGHAALLNQLTESARKVGGPPMVLTFDPHPAAVLRPSAAPERLTWMQRRAEMLAQHDVDQTIVCETDTQLLEMSAASFFEAIVVDLLDAKAVVEGPNFFFGKDREGNIDRLRELCELHQRQLNVVTPVRQRRVSMMEGDREWMVSSTLIRAAIKEGRVKDAAEMLNGPYAIRGRIQHGAARGRTIGFPTANLHHVDTLVPGHGVYAAMARIGANQDTPDAFAMDEGGEKKWRIAAVHIGA
ncbi:MAG: riboflavin kinase, partial [Planctomycetota bacterium]